MVDYDKAVISAKTLLENSKANEKRPVNLAIILNELGLNAIYSEDIEDEALLNPMEKTIYVKVDDKPMTRKLFSIAHEIGHWVLHSRNKIRPRINFEDNNPFRSQEEIAEEKEANAFASELLMPYNEVRNMIMIGYSVEDIMNYFNVSYAFAYNRYNFIIGRLY